MTTPPAPSWVDIMNQSRVGRYMHRVESAIIARYLPQSPQHVLDLGGGTGRWSRWLMERGHQQTLLEIDRGNFRELYHSQIMAVQADAQALPFPAARFDAVIAVQLFGLLPDENRFFAELHRAMKPGAWLFISWTNRASLKGWLYSSYSSLKGTSQADRHGFYQHSHHRNLALLQSHGFTPIYMEGYSWQLLPRSHDGPLVDVMTGLERGLGLHRWPAASPNVILAAQKV